MIKIESPVFTLGAESHPGVVFFALFIDRFDKADLLDEIARFQTDFFRRSIGLDRLNQGKLAQTYYQRALTLAQDTAAAFDPAALRKRLQELGGSAR